VACNTSPTTGAFSCDDTSVGFPPSSTPPITADHSAFDWATIIGGTLGIVGQSIQQANTPKVGSVGSYGIPTSRTPGVAPASQTTGIVIIAVVLGLFVWLVSRVGRRR
jgi:hypothetical protein